MQYPGRLPTFKEWEATNTELEKNKKEVEDRNKQIDEIKKKLETALIVRFISVHF